MRCWGSVRAEPPKHPKTVISKTIDTMFFIIGNQLLRGIYQDE
jgi:hypothetical protein